MRQLAVIQLVTRIQNDVEDDVMCHLNLSNFRATGP